MSSSNTIPEITFRVVILAILLASILVISNTYLALKIGILTTASIPAAVLSMGILRFFKRSSILENNLVQTAASAGEAVAGGIVYTIPALVIIRYWTRFNYWENFTIALVGGILGVLFSIPLRRVLMTEKHLNFPEGKAIAEVLQIGAKREIGMREMLFGGGIGAAIELAQNGLKIAANNLQLWLSTHGSVVGFGTGLSATLIGAGYLIGIHVGVSLLVGAIIGWLICVPMLSVHYGLTLAGADTTQIAITLWNEKIRYIGIGAMLSAGFWTLLHLAKPFYESMHASFKAITTTHLSSEFSAISRTERDIPIFYVLSGIAILFIFLYFIFKHTFNMEALALASTLHIPFILASMFYVLIVGFIFSAICAYFSGLVGVTASPGSAIMIGSLLLVTLLIRALLGWDDETVLSQEQLRAGAAIVIVIGAVIMGAAALADNIQVLKVGHIVGATPWKQQIMLMLGVLVAAGCVPLIMELLFNVYGIGDIYPHPNMDHSQVLAAPPAAMLAAMTQGVFHHDLPWNMVIFGCVITAIAIFINYFLEKHQLGLSILGIAIGIYLPLSSSTALFLGSLFFLINKRALAKQQDKLDKLALGQKRQRGLLLACGLVSGSALMDVILAIPFAIQGNPDALAIMPTDWQGIAKMIGIAIAMTLGAWFYRVVTKD